VSKDFTKDILKAQNGDKYILQKIVQENQGLVWGIVKRFSGRGYEIEDLYQIGAIGFIKAIKRFDVNFDVQLSTYAVPYIIGEIKRFIRDDGPIKVSRSIKELNIKIKEFQKRYLLNNGIEASLSDIAKEFKINKEEVTEALEASKPIESIYQETEGKDSSIALIDKICTDEDEVAKIDNKLAIKELISNLENRDREIILLRYYKDKTQSQVAKILGISQVQVSRIEKKILNSMRLKIVS